MTIFRRNIASVTPLPDEARKSSKAKRAAFLESKGLALASKDSQRSGVYHSGGTSMSFPLTERLDVDLLGLSAPAPKPKIDIEKVYREKLEHRLSDNERRVMELALGVVEMGGALNTCEVARELNVSRATVRIHEKRALQKAEAAGKVKIKRRLSLAGPAAEEGIEDFEELWWVGEEERLADECENEPKRLAVNS